MKTLSLNHTGGRLYFYTFCRIWEATDLDVCRLKRERRPTIAKRSIAEIGEICRFTRTVTEPPPKLFCKAILPPSKTVSLFDICTCTCVDIAMLHTVKHCPKNVRFTVLPSTKSHTTASAKQHGNTTWILDFWYRTASVYQNISC